MRNIYALAPIQVTENYCRNKSLKISEYLKDRRSHTHQCIQEFKSIISSIPYESTGEAERYVTITLYSLRTLCEHSKDFLPITYLLLYNVMRLPYFQQVKAIVYDILKTATTMYPGEDINALEDIMSELVRYLSDPKHVSNHEIKLLSSISIPLHDRIAENSCFDWRKLVNLILERIIANSEVDEDLLLLATFSKLLLSMKSVGELFLEHLIEFFDRNNSWSHSSDIFHAIISSSKEYFNDKSSAVTKLLINYAISHQYKYIAEVSECISQIIGNAEVINTLHYSTDWKDVLVKSMHYSASSGTEVMELWVFKADVQSFFRLVKYLLFTEEHTHASKALFTICKQRIDSEFRGQCSMNFLQPMLELIYDIIVGLKENYSDLVLKVRNM